MTVFDEEQTQNENSEEGSDEEYPDNHWDITHKMKPYVPAVLALTETDKEHPPTLK